MNKASVQNIYDVVKVDHETRRVSLIANGKKEKDAEAICKLATLRHGCNDAFFAVISAGKYQEGDAWAGLI